MRGKTASLKHLSCTKKARSRMKNKNEAGFNLRKWMSSSKRLMEWIDEEEEVPVEEVVKLSEEDITYAQTQFGVQGCSETVSREKKILGFNWNIERDTFVFQFDWLMEFARELPLNQRTVLKFVAKLYETIFRIKLLASLIPSRLIIPEIVQPYFR